MVRERPGCDERCLVGVGQGGVDLAWPCLVGVGVGQVGVHHALMEVVRTETDHSATQGFGRAARMPNAMQQRRAPVCLLQNINARVL